MPITNAVAGDLNWTARASSPDWLIIDKASGGNGESVKFHVDPSAQRYTNGADRIRGAVTIPAPGATAQNLAVLLTITDPRPAAGPVISLDLTPVIFTAKESDHNASPNAR